MAGKIHIRGARTPVFFLPFVLLLFALAIVFFVFFGAVALVGAGVLGLGSLVFGRFFGRSGKKDASFDSDGDVITLGRDDYEIKEVEPRSRNDEGSQS